MTATITRRVRDGYETILVGDDSPKTILQTLVTEYRTYDAVGALIAFGYITDITSRRPLNALNPNDSKATPAQWHSRLRHMLVDYDTDMHYLWADGRWQGAEYVLEAYQ